MTIRPIDIARKLNISTTTLRMYEEMELAPIPNRTDTGYREYTEEHVAYFVCVREMLPAFDLTFIKSVLKEIQNENFDNAFLLINNEQADLWNDRQISKKFSDRVSRKNSNAPIGRPLTIGSISKETGIPVTTIRHWEKVGLVKPLRSPTNNYRYYTDEHINHLLTLHTIKLSIQSHRRKHFISAIKEAYQNFNRSNENEVNSLIENITKRINEINRLQMRAIAAVCSLCQQVEDNQFYTFR